VTHTDVHGWLHIAVSEQELSAWLKRRVLLGVPLNLLGALVPFGFGLAIVFIIFWAIYYIFEANQ